MFQTNVVEKIKTHSVFSNPPPTKKIVPFVMWKNIVERGRQQLTVYYGACAVHAGYLRLQTDSGCAILVAFHTTKRMHESASTLRSTYTAYLVILSITGNT
jgi:hypothetical protein